MCTYYIHGGLPWLALSPMMSNLQLKSCDVNYWANSSKLYQSYCMWKWVETWYNQSWNSILVLFWTTLAKRIFRTFWNQNQNWPISCTVNSTNETHSLTFKSHTDYIQVNSDCHMSPKKRKTHLDQNSWNCMAQLTSAVTHIWFWQASPKLQTFTQLILTVANQRACEWTFFDLKIKWTQCWNLLRSLTKWQSFFDDWYCQPIVLSDRSEQTYKTDRKVCIELLKNVVK